MCDTIRAGPGSVWLLPGLGVGFRAGRLLQEAAATLHLGLIASGIYLDHFFASPDHAVSILILNLTSVSVA